MSMKVSCPGCSKTFNAPKEYVGRKVKCPACKEAFVIPASASSGIREIEKPPARPTKTPLPDKNNSRDLFDYAVYFSLGAIPLIAIVAVADMLFGSSDLFLLLGGTCLLLSLFFFAKYSNMARIIRHQKTENESLLTTIAIRTKDLDEALTKFSVFEENFESLSRKEFLRLQEKYADIENREKTIDRLGKRFLADTVKWVSIKLTSNNFTASSDRLRKAVEFCRKHEYRVSPDYEKELFDNLKREYESVLRKEHAKEEQARIKARIREEQKAEKALEQEMRRIEAEKVAIEKALQIALRDAKDEHSAEIEALRDRLREAEEKGQRAMSMAQQTRSGHVYVISNIGSFGEEVFKIGMTRRLEPLDRVKELGDASVPFPFDVHMMISCDDAPTLENTLHKVFHTKRLNKVNLRREYFRVNLDEIRKVVEENHGEVDYVAEPEALQYRESISMTDEDFAFVSSHNQDLDFDDDDDFVE